MNRNKIIGVVVALLVVMFFLWGEFAIFAPNGPALSEILSDRQNMNENKMILQSPAFPNGGWIPSKYTCDELNLSPPLIIANVPEGTKSLVLVVDDPDVPKELRPDGVFDHWVVYNIDPGTSFINEGQIFGTAGLNGRGESKYTGPCPPPQFKPTTHRYFFSLYALNTTGLNFIKAPTKNELLTAIQSYVIEGAELVGLYDRNKTVSEND